MKNLTIMRHAKSSWESPGIKDIARTLNERGSKALLLVGKYLKKMKLNPDMILSSPATRALQTAIGIGEQLGYNTGGLKIAPEIYYNDSAALLRLIKQSDNKYNDIVLVGHEPVLSSFIHILTGNMIEKFPTCSAYRVSFDIKEWSEIKPGSGKCEFFVNPKLLGEK